MIDTASSSFPRRSRAALLHLAALAFLLVPLRALGGDRGIQFGQPVNNSGAILLDDQAADQLAQSNARFVRVNLRNPWCTDTAAFYSAYDTIINRLQARGLIVIGLLSNEFYLDGQFGCSGGGQAAWNEDAWELGGVDSYNTFIDGFGYQAARVIAHYRNNLGVRYWEVWNEPNAWTVSTPPGCGYNCGGSYIYPSTFSRLLGHVYTQVKYYAVYDVVILSGGLFGHNISGNNTASAGSDYLSATYSYGVNHGDWSWIKAHAGSYPLDQVGYHLYLKNQPSLTTDVQTYLGWIRSAYTAYEGASTPKQIYITEIGWRTDDGNGNPSPANEAAQASALTTSFNVTLNTSYVSLSTWFFLRDENGWPEKWGLLRSDGANKPGFAAFGGSTGYGGTPIALANSGIESNGSSQYGAITSWGPNGGWAWHSGYPKGANGGLGAAFGFYSAGAAEIVGQVSATRFTTSSRYDFTSWAQGGGDNAGRVPYQLGYAATDNNLASFTPLALEVVDITGNQAWFASPGVAYTTDASRAEINKQIVVRLGGSAQGGSSDVWFDNFTLKRQNALVLANAGIETDVSGQYGAIDGWGPNGGWAYHSGYARAGNEGLGARFGYYSAGGAETVGQLLTTRFAANTTYTFRSFAQGGGDNTGRVPYQIGYAQTDNSLSSFVALATRVVDVGAAWKETEGVVYTTGSTGAALGKQIIVRLGGSAQGGSSDVWFDQLSLAIR